VVGQNEANCTVRNNVALNARITRTIGSLNLNIGRVVGVNNNGTLTNNYGRTGMIVNGQIIQQGSPHISIHGANVSDTDALNSTRWTTAGNWDSASPWDFVNVWYPPSGDILPTLRGTPILQEPRLQDSHD
jgi:hypothetical protein